METNKLTKYTMIGLRLLHITSNQLEYKLLFGPILHGIENYVILNIMQYIVYTIIIIYVYNDDREHAEG